MNHCYSPLACPCGNCRRKKQDISTPKCPKCHSHFYLPYIVASATTKTISVCIHCAFDLCSKHDGDLYIAPNHELRLSIPPELSKSIPLIDIIDEKFSRRSNNPKHNPFFGYGK